MKLKLALKVKTPPKLTIKSSANEKKFSSMRTRHILIVFFFMIIENHMENSIYESIPKIENAKEFLDFISKKYTKFLKNEKNELSDNYWVNVHFESNVIDVPSDTWLDSGANIHACNSMQAVISRRSPTSLEQYVYMGDNTRI